MAESPASLAVTHFLAVKEMLDTVRINVEEEMEKSVGASLRTRAREAPGLMLDAGVAGLLAFYASKSRMELAEKLHSVLANGESVEGILEGGLFNYVKEELIKSGKGYTILLAMITACLDSYKLLSQGRDYTERLAKTIRELLDSPEKSAAAQVVLHNYMSNVKRLVEAVVKEEGE